MDIYTKNEIILQSILKEFKPIDYELPADLMTINGIDPIKLYQQNEKILKKMDNIKSCKNQELPKYIMVEHNRLLKLSNKKDNLLVLEQDRLENKYPFIHRVAMTKDDDISCCALTMKLSRCSQMVTYKLDGLVDSDNNNKYKGTLYFCAQHIKQMMDSKDCATLKNGFFFESDKYKKN